MAHKLNKKVLCFVDEYGTAGSGDLYLGVVLVLARDAGRIDKCFSDQLEPSANEIHAVDLADGYLQGLMQRFWERAPKDGMIMINRKLTSTGGSPPVLYAKALIETVKIGVKRFRKDIFVSDRIGNIEVITDVNQHNSHPDFDAAIAAAQNDGAFRGVTRVVCLDSSASRLLQLADTVAHSRKWILGAEINAGGLRSRFGIHTMA